MNNPWGIYDATLYRACKSLALSLCWVFESAFLFAQTFTEVSLQSGINHVAIIQPDSTYLPGGAAWFDYDNDGFLDIYLTGGTASDKLYRNNGDGSFSDMTTQAGFSGMAGKETNGVVSGDIDNDGFRDLFITTSRHFHNYLFRNNGDGTFTDISLSAGFTETVESASAAFGDCNKDGFIDLFVANWAVDIDQVIGTNFLRAHPNNFYLNNGNNTFTDIGSVIGVADTFSCSLAATFSDFDLDGDQDLLIANDFGNMFNNHNQLFQNNFPQNNLTDVSAASGFGVGMSAMGIASGDYDEDGDFDYFITNIGRDVLMRNNGNGTFSNAIQGSGLARHYASIYFNGSYYQWTKVSWGTGFFDYNNDTHLDLFVAAGDLLIEYPHPSADTNKLFQGNSSGTFTDVTTAAGVGDIYVARGFSYADYDNDGDLDLLVCHQDTAGGSHHTLLYRNNLSLTSWVKIQLVGIQSNADGLGALITLKEGGRVFLREVDGGSSFNSHNDYRIHFGLGNLLAPGDTVDSLIIRWLSGTVDRFANIISNKIYIAEEGGALIPGVTVPLRIHYSESAIACHGGTASVTIFASGGVPPYSGTGVFSVQAGVHQFIVFDAEGSSDSIAVTTSEPPPLLASTLIDTIRCRGDTGAVAVFASGGVPPYSGIGTFFIHTSGTYSYMVNDKNGCLSSVSLNVQIPDSLVASATVTHLTCFAGANGVAELNVNGGTAPYTFLWNDGETMALRSGLPAGDYSVTVTDRYSCSASASFLVRQPDELSIIVQENSVSCFAGNDGSVEIRIQGGTPAYQYLWSSEANSGMLTAGNYSLTVVDANGCSSSAEFFISQPDSIHIKLVSMVEDAGNAEGKINIAVNGGIPPYTFTWSNGIRTEDISQLVAGYYSVTVTDANNCQKSLENILVPSFTAVQKEKEDVGFSAFPNPFSGKFFIMGLGDASEVSLISPNGKTMKVEFADGSGRIEMNLSHLLPSIYFVAVKSDGLIQRFKIVKTED